MKKVYYYLIGIIALIISFIFDKQISIFFTSHRVSFLSSIAIFINYIEWYFLFGFVLLILILAKKYKKIIPMFVSLILYLVLTEGIKVLVARPRPFVTLNNSLVNDPDPYTSFPSGHATAMFSLLNVMSFIKYTWLTLSIIVSLSRVYLGVHYLSDVIAGALLGYLIGDLTVYLMNKYKIKLKQAHRKV